MFPPPTLPEKVNIQDGPSLEKVNIQDGPSLEKVNIQDGPSLEKLHRLCGRRL